MPSETAKYVSTTPAELNDLIQLAETRSKLEPWPCIYQIVYDERGRPRSQTSGNLVAIVPALLAKFLTV